MSFSFKQFNHTFVFMLWHQCPNKVTICLFTNLMLGSHTSYQELVQGEHAFPVLGLVAWNALPANICSTVDPKLFKRLLKTFFNLAFDITV